MIKSIICIGALMVGFAAHADEQLAGAMCGYIKEDNRNQLRKTLSENKINIRNIFGSIACNGENMLQFAIRSDAYESGTFLVKQMPSKTLADFDYAGWASSNGFAASPLVNEIKTRIGE